MKFIRKNLFSIILLIIIVAQTVYFSISISLLKISVEGSFESIAALSKRIDKVISLNNLEHYDYTIITNEKEWKPLLKDETGLTIPDNWKISEAKVKKFRDYEKDSQFTLVFSLDDKLTFNDIAQELYNKALKLSDDSIVMSFDKVKGYYDITSFNEATYNNMYYDFAKYSKEPDSYSFRIKLKLLHLKDTNQAKLEVNVF